ncbi:phosphopantothenoylcysteine decarboxylase/phosphopantothenate--cysteine ligase [Oceanococcus atlanticus]|uniref:Coenzyme A biosynthesis bifunctional protein CoaBC n=1 Tax=Oceanococcus atlanticus TaxID=1317117 RepID=A0A1Y1SB11_9GAMM|nr:bifunctional phosphopantothenoylcysteine decarboxylase/phosphopantothenate--cysteine ligase CoaBC [Oceanococcus atlanticus]ORE85242.1 phosphopantothenoylcysteine decarboxylase/phosphopantothenate--cysteine ligase [Oceanococcus atlanticus]
MNVLLGVSGGIAAYKSADLVRRLRERGCDVQVVMTRAAQEFVTPLTFQALSGREVRTALLDSAAEAAMGHIELARWADRILIAPASADLIARLTAGMADDLLTTVCLASAAPISLAPAMNQQMWQAPAVQANVATLRERGIEILGPGEGDQACGDIGPGRMLEPLELADMITDEKPDGVLAGLRVLITAGPTREALDPVRFLTNRSSGKMGFALAAACQAAGAQVELIAGPVNLPTPIGVRRYNVESAQQMLDKANERVGKAQILIATAAVADYRPRAVQDDKIKKSSDSIALELEKTPDILGELSRRETHLFTVGFAAETRELERYARAKMQRKNLDMICANEVGPGQGFDVDENALLVFWPGGQQQLGPRHKRALAGELVDLIATRYATGDEHAGAVAP